MSLLSLGCHDPEVGPAPGAAPQELASEERAVRFTLRPEAVANLRLTTVEAGPAELVGTRTYPGVVRYNDTKRAHLVSQVEGVVRRVHVTLGEHLTATDTVASIDSRELAEARSRFIDALHQERLRTSMFEAEKALWSQQITSKDAYLLAEAAASEARLEAAAAGQGLRSLGLGPDELLRLKGVAEEQVRSTAQGTDSVVEPALSALDVHAPAAGQVIGVMVSNGEAIAPGQEIIEVADLSTVWVDARIPTADLALVTNGHPVAVRWTATTGVEPGALSYIATEVDAASQTVLGRIELPNPNGHWRPGLFVHVDAEVEREQVDLAVPTAALVADPESPGRFLVFVQLKRGEFEATAVEVLRTAGDTAAISGDLSPGDRVVVGETLFLKAVWLGEGGLEE